VAGCLTAISQKHDVVTRQSRPDRVHCAAGGSGVDLLEAHFERHVYDRHMHDTYAIGITLRGVQRFWCRGARHDSTRGHVIIINPGDVHDGQSGSAGGYAYRMFYVSRDVIATSLEDLLEHNSEIAAPCPVLSDPDLAHHLDAAWNATVTAPRSLIADELLHQSLCLLAIRCGARPRTVHSHRDPAVLRQIRDYLHDHVDSEVSLADLSAMARMSRFRLTRMFQKAYGMPVHAYHLQLRLAEARTRLARGQSIAAVASDLKFVDQSHLHRRFKGTFGITPGQWRGAHGYKTGRIASVYRRGHDAPDAARHVDQAIRPAG